MMPDVEARAYRERNEKERDTQRDARPWPPSETDRTATMRGCEIVGSLCVDGLSMGWIHDGHWNEDSSFSVCRTGSLRTASSGCAVRPRKRGDRSQTRRACALHRLPHYHLICAFMLPVWTISNFISPRYMPSIR